jgi:hypothetical protein
MTTATKNKTKSTRRVSTRQDKVDAINYIRVMCEKKAKINDGFIKNRFGVWYVIRRLVNDGILIRVGKPDNSGIYSQSKTYSYHPGKLTTDDIIDLIWQIHGHEDANAFEEAREQKKKTLRQLEIIQPEVANYIKATEPSPAVDLNGIVPYYNGELSENIDGWLKMCDEFKIGSKGAFIAAQLKMMGYAK